MKSERLAYAFGKINDDLIYGAVNDTKKKYGWRRGIALKFFLDRHDDLNIACVL